ncbi:flagellar motor protein MotB [Rhodanobacter thiooxydans]|uniref:Flagellar motor protein MotB n=1 Tax=Rhodanobacter thiooxydans TaxID=416169 RepID=A0A154QD80_9GAMM|nr:flagellar motor protein MotD [Rhodanobacter thiooxydans]EIL96844.1 flagellar motor protein MotD [Rhodanobacter thiooxydans LCS2]KZC22148.1 flagellar motor protein MotB [Rhodanobacter thiooxydans]MCW0201467.1 flagellar motor protein MotD [Rhodanobacter thiooxydans]
MRRHKHEEHQNHEAWAIPYADLMTLLLAFFVVMYAVSVVNEGKFRVMSESLIEAFNGSSHAIAPLPPTKIRPHNVAPAIAAPAGQSGSSIVPIAVPIPPHPVPASGGKGREAGHRTTPQQNLGQIESEVRKALQPLIDRRMVNVRNKVDWLEIEIRTDILFPSGVAQLSAPAQGILHSLAGVLGEFANPLRIEGFTDDMPINTALYPSNWELSAARAGSVARLFATSGVAQDRLGIIGWGEMHPVADNATVEGRNQNRRVLVVVMGNSPLPSREHSDADDLGQHAGVAVAPVPDVLPTVRAITPLTPASLEAGAANGVPAAAPVAATAVTPAAGDRPDSLSERTPAARSVR